MTGRRGISVVVLGVGIALAAAVPAVADEDLTAGISNVRSSGTDLTGVLTLRSTDALKLDSGSLTAKIGGARYPATVVKSSQTARLSMLVIDTSGSMGMSGMATVRAAAASYLKAVPADVLVGVASFATTAGVDLPPTKDRAEVQRVVNGFAARGDTSLYAGVQAAIAGLGNTGDRSIVLLSDGADTIATKEAQARAETVAALKRKGVRVDVVRFKTTDSDATAALRAFADANGGSVVSADNTSAVSDAFRASARALESQAQFEITLDAPPAGSQTLEIKGTAGGQPFVGVQKVDFGLASAPIPSAAPSRAPAQAATVDVAAAVASPMTWLPAVAAGLLAIGLLILGFAAFGPEITSRRERRLALIERHVAPIRRVSRSEAKVQQSPITEQLIGAGERLMKDRRGTDKTIMLIDRADLPLRAGEWLILRVVAVVVLTILGAVFLDGAPTIGLGLGMLLGVILPPIILRYLAGRRARAFERQLPDVLSVAATSLSSGFGLNQALDSIARDSAEPTAKEFSRVLAETRIGTEVPDALERMAIRMDSTAMEWVVMALRIQRDVGGNLAETLRTTVHTLREREALNGQVRALSAEGRLSGYILMALPVGLFLYMLVVSRDYVQLLWTRPLGIFMIVTAVVLTIIGFFWMRRVARIEV